MLTLQLAAAQAEFRRAQAELAQAEAEVKYRRLLAEHALRKQASQPSSNVPLFPSTSPLPATPSSDSSPSPLTVDVPVLQSRKPPRRNPPSTPVSELSSTSSAAEEGSKRRKSFQYSSESTKSQIDSPDEDTHQPQPRKHRVSQSKRMWQQTSGRVGVRQRRLWLRHACGDKTSTVTHSMKGIPPFYHPDLDELSSSDSVRLQPVPEPWQAEQPTLVAWFTEVLQHRHYKTSRGADSNGREGDSDWEAEYREAVTAGWVREDPLEMIPGRGWSVRMLMSDRLYLELTNVLLNSNPLQYLDSLSSTQPQLHKVIQRQLDEHARYHLFWAHANVCAPDRPDAIYARLIPALYRVEGSCQSQYVTLSDCKRCIPLSQVALVLDSFHSGGSHLKDSYLTISQHYCGIPRKAIRLFAAKCHACNRAERSRRTSVPRAPLW